MRSLGQNPTEAELQVSFYTTVHFWTIQRVT